MSIKTKIFTYIAAILCLAAILLSIHDYNNIPVSSRATFNNILATRQWVVDYSTNAISSISNYVDSAKVSTNHTGNVTIIGDMMATSFIGNGSGLTDLNISESDPVALPVASNALALAATALQPAVMPTSTFNTDEDITLAVVPTRGIYNLYVQGDSNISFDLSSIDITNNVARWETWIKVFAPGMTVGLPSTNAVQYREIPDLTTTTANELLQISWQAWMDGTNLMMQGHLYNRNTQMPPPTLAELRTYHYGSPTIEESPDGWFEFDPETGTIIGFYYESGREDVVIPWEIGGVAVEALGEMAFSPDLAGHPVETMIGPKTVLSIGNYAFASCSLLTSVIIPAATSIGSSAFSSCTSLNDVSLPVATSIGEYAFENCSSLTSAIIPVATSIGNGAFYDCSSLTSIILPVATSIGYNLFYNCTSLTDASLPVATSIGNYAFDNCMVLTSVIIPAATSIGSSAFSGCYSLTSISLPVATSIGNYAFDNCMVLTSVIIPAATSIGDGAFVNCTSLTSIYFGTAKPPEASDVFYEYGDPINATIYYPTGASAWSGVTTWCGMSTATYTPPAP